MTELHTTLSLTSENPLVPESELSRMRTLFGTARFMLRAEETLRQPENRQSTIEDLEKMIKESPGEDLTPLKRAILGEYMRLTGEIDHALKVYAEEAKTSECPIETAFIRGFILDVEKEPLDLYPKGNITLSSEFPLALEALAVDDDDYKILARVKNIQIGSDKEEGGNFKEEITTVAKVLNKKVRFPFLALRQMRKGSINSQDRIRNHERNHARNYAIERACRNLVLESASSNAVIRDPNWGSLIQYRSYSAVDALCLAVDAGGQSIDSVVASDDFLDLLSFTTSEAKDELVADMGDRFATIETHIDNILTFRIYDPLRYAFWKNSELEQRYRQEYAQWIETNTSGVVELQRGYRKILEQFPSGHEHVWANRQQILGPLFAQIPLYEWQTVAGEGSALRHELQQFEEFIQQTDEILDCYYYTSNWKNMEPTQAELDQLNSIRNIRSEFEQFVFEHSDEYLLDEIVNFQKRMDVPIHAIQTRNPQRLSYYRQFKYASDLIDNADREADYVKSEFDENNAETRALLDDQMIAARKLQDRLSEEMTTVGPSVEFFNGLNEQAERIFRVIKSVDPSVSQNSIDNQTIL